MVSSSLKHQRGFGLVQVGIGIALFGMVSAYGIHMYAKSAKESVIDDRAKLVGQRMADIDAAVKSYATQYFVQVQKGEPAQAVTGGYTVPASRVRQPTLQDLVQLGMLRSDAANSLTYNNQTISYAVDFTVDTTGCVIPACNIQAVIRTTAPITDTEGNVDVRRATIAANEASQNNAGVAIPASAGGDPSKFVGTQGVVVAANPTGTAGLIGMRTAYDSKGFMEFDRRDGTLARTGVLRMQDDTGQRHDITGAGQVNAQAVTASKLQSSGDVTVGGYLDLSTAPVVTADAACPKNGLVARDNKGAMMSCQNGKWANASGSDGASKGTKRYFFDYHAGKTSSCTAMYTSHRAEANVDQEGNVTLRLLYKNSITKACVNQWSCGDGSYMAELHLWGLKLYRTCDRSSYDCGSEPPMVCNPFPW